jgi:hypothetical protein
MVKKGKSATAQNMISISHRLVYPITTIRDAENALMVEQNKLDEWIQKLYTPNLNDLSIVSQNLKSIKAIISALAENETLESQLEALKRHCESLESQLAAVTARVAALGRAVEKLTDRVAGLEGDSTTSEARSIVHAAEIRFIKLLCKDMTLADTYSTPVRMCDIIEDIGDGSAPQSVIDQWSRLKNMWDSKSMKRLMSNLSNSRGDICHKEEDRQPEKYAGMTKEAVQGVLEKVVLTDSNTISLPHIAAALKVHCITATVSPSNLSSDIDSNC